MYVGEQKYNLSVSMYVEKEDTKEKIDIDVRETEISDTVMREDALRRDIDNIVTMLWQSCNIGEVSL